MRAMSALLLLLLLLLSEQERLQVRARVGAVFRKYGCALLLLHALKLSRATSLPVVLHHVVALRMKELLDLDQVVYYTLKNPRLSHD